MTFWKIGGIFILMIAVIGFAVGVASDSPIRFWMLVMTGLGLFMTFAPIGFQRKPIDPAAEAKFKAADNLISSQKNVAAHGNCEEALKVAASYSDTSKLLSDVALESGQKSLFTNEDFLTYVHLTPEIAIFLVRLPNIHELPAKKKQAIVKIAWLNAQEEISFAKPKPVKLALGICGATNYEQLYIGHVVAECDNTNTGIDRIVKGDSLHEELVALFATEPPSKK